jgi:hypothetical protein
LWRWKIWRVSFPFPLLLNGRIWKEEAESFLSPPLQHLQNGKHGVFNGKTWGFPMEKHWVFLEVGAPQNQQNPLVSCWNHFSQALASSTYRASAERARGAQWKRGLWEPIFFCLFQCLDSDISSIFQW